MVKEWLVILSENVVPLIDMIALVFVAFGALEASVKGIQSMRASMDASRFRLIWMRFARWLIAGLTFQLAADMIESSIAPTWEEIGQLGAIAVIRTFLNFFLERDQREAVELVNEETVQTPSTLSRPRSDA